MKKFPICFWNYATFDQIGENAVKDWLDAGFTMAMSPMFRKGIDRPEQMIKLLDECLEKDITVIIDDWRCRWNSLKDGEESFRNGFKEMLEEFGNHEAVYGFYVGDEPGSEEMEYVLKAIKIEKELCPDKKPFVNFNQYKDGEEDSHQNGMDFDDWAHDFAVKSNIEQFSYDCYAAMKKDDAYHKFINHYYLNLWKWTNAAKRENIPLWVTNLSVPHFQFRVLKDDDFRWQLNTTVASGAASAWWFFLYYRLARVNYRQAPIDEYGKRTETYTSLARVQNIFQHQFGLLFPNLIHDETYHIGLAFGGYPLFMYNKNKYLKRVQTKDGCPALVSFFHTNKNDLYMAFVNNSQTDTDIFKLEYQECVKEVYRVVYDYPVFDPENIERDKLYPKIRTEYGSVEANVMRGDNWNKPFVDKDRIHDSYYLAPGQMEVFRLVLR